MNCALIKKIGFHKMGLHVTFLSCKADISIPVLKDVKGGYAETGLKSF